MSGSRPTAPAPTPTPPSGGSDGASSLQVAGLIIAGVAALLGAAAQATDGFARAVGGAVGVLAVIAIVAFLFRRFASERAGWIAVIVMGALATFGSIVQFADRNQTDDRIGEAIDELDLPANGFEPTDAERRCIADSGFTDDDVLTALTDTGLEGSERQLELFDAVARCSPRALTTDANVEGFRRSFSASFQGEIDAVEARCMITGIAEAPVPSELASGADPEGYLALAEECLREETLALLLRESGTGAQAVGEDPDLDRLAGWCTDGDDVACDLLFETASLGSEYFTLAENCAERGGKSDSYCTEGMLDEDGSGFIDAASPGWATVISDCEGGRMLSCDFAFATAELGSEQERVGETCGGRRAVSNGSLCLEAYGEIAQE